MGCYLAFGPCIGCGHVFSFNPDKVPSTSAVTGKREPICQTCVDRVNPMRIKNGLAPIAVLPGAYDVQDEEEM